jgi:hypothetical protein
MLLIDCGFVAKTGRQEGRRMCLLKETKGLIKGKGFVLNVLSNGVLLRLSDKKREELICAQGP